MPASTKHVFMSYSRNDESVMRRIVTFLRNQGINIWVDNEKLVPGTPIWEEEIEKAIRSSSAIIAVLSPDAKNSVWVRREISFAERYHKRIFPIMVAGDEDSSITLRLTTNQYVDIRQNGKIDIGLNALKIALSFYLEELETRELAESTQEKNEEIKLTATVPQNKILRLLIADDVQETRRNVRLMLATIDNVEVVALAGNGKQALKLAIEHRPDVIILDINMPEMDGLTAYLEIQKVLPNIECVFISAEKDITTLRTAMSTGVREYLVKPFTVEELETSIARVRQRIIRQRK